MSYLERLKAKISETPYAEELPKLTEPGFVGFVGTPDRHVSEKIDPERLIQYWRRALGRLDSEAPLGGFALGRWEILLHDAYRIFNEVGVNAAKLGWSATDLWGVDPAGASGVIVGGLAYRLSGGALIGINGERAEYRLPFSGQLCRCAKGWDRGLVPVWELNNGNA